MTTSDGGAIPAGSTWLLSQIAPAGATRGAEAFFAAQVVPDQGGTLAIALPSGSLLPIANPVALGSYTLTIVAPGYRTLVSPIDHHDAGGATTVVVEVIAIQAPTATASPTGGAVPTSTATATMAVSDLPNTGAGDRGAGQWSWSWPLLLLAGGGLAALGGAIGCRRQRR